MTYEQAKKTVADLGGDGGSVLLTEEDYLLGIFDMVGELMRFSITAMATSGELPGSFAIKEVVPIEEHAVDKMDVEPSSSEEQHLQKRDVLADLRVLRLCLEGLELSKGSMFEKDVEKKMRVMKDSVEKVEKALYGLIVRGQERPKGWVPDLREETRAPEVVEGY